MQLYAEAVNRFNKATPQQRSYLSIGLTLALLIILILLVFPAVNHILKLNREISDGRVVEQKLQQKVAALEQAEENYSRLKDRLEIADEALPTGSAINTYLKTIEDTAKKQKVSLEGIQFSDVPLSLPINKRNLRVREINYSVTIGGKFTSLEKFITDMENIIRTTDLTSIAITEDGSSITGSLQAVIYYLGEQAVRTTQTKEGQSQSTPEVEAGQ